MNIQIYYFNKRRISFILYPTFLPSIMSHKLAYPIDFPYIRESTYNKWIMERIDNIIQALSSALYLLNNEIQCVEEEALAEEYQEVIDNLKNALQIAREMANA